MGMNNSKYPAGSLVFAKVKGYPPWPARITGPCPKDRYKIYFYGTYEIATLKGENIWPFNQETKDKFASKNIQRKGYSQGLVQIELTPEIARVEGDDGDRLDVRVSQDSQVRMDNSQPSSSRARKKLKEADVTTETKKISNATAQSVVESRAKMKNVDGPTSGKPEVEPPSTKKTSEQVAAINGEKEEKSSWSGRATIKPKRFGDDRPVVGLPKSESKVTETGNRDIGGGNN